MYITLPIILIALLWVTCYGLCIAIENHNKEALKNRPYSHAEILAAVRLL